MKRIKSKIIIAISIMLVLLFLLFSKTVISSVKYSMRLCYTSVIPSLFPFFILCEFLMCAVGNVSKNPGKAAYFTSLLTGFPTGVKNVCKLYEDGYIDKKNAVAVLYCSANASPAYVITFIGMCIIKSKTAGIILLSSQIVASFVCAVFFGVFKNRQRSRKIRTGVINITDTACISISNSVISCLYVCGYIIFFGIFADIIDTTGIPDYISRLVQFLPAWLVRGVILGAVEISRGVSALDFNHDSAIVISAAILGFSGVSVIMQCMNCAIQCGLPKKPIIYGKLIYMFFMPAITYCICKIMPYRMETAVQNENPFIPFALFLIFVLFCIIFIYNIFDKSNCGLYNE